MSDRDAQGPVLPVNVTRGLMDKLVEKRKTSAIELERTVKDLVSKNEFGLVKDIIIYLKDDFTLSSNPNSRKGGLVGIAAIAIGLGRPCIGMNLPELVQPVLVCFEDPDPRVRYYACESLYNISKIARGAVLVFFNLIFDGLCKLFCDSDANVRYGAELLDRLMKDVVSENPHFDVDNFIMLLRDRMLTRDAYARTFLVSWVIFLDSVPDIHMHEHVPEFLDGLFGILGDQNHQIKKMTEDALGELLREIRCHSHSVRFDAMTNIVANHCQSEDKVIQLIALRWLDAFLDLSGRTMLCFAANILVAVLPSLAFVSDRESIRKVAVKVNSRLKNLVIDADDGDLATDLQDEDNIRLATQGTSSSSTTAETSKASPASTPSSSSSHKKDSESADLEEKEKIKGMTDKTKSSQGEALAQEPCRLNLLTVLGVLIPHMKFTAMETRLETLRWVLWLHNKLPTRLYRQVGKLFPHLLDMLTDGSDKVLNLNLQVIAALSTSKGGQDRDDQLEAAPVTSNIKPTKAAGLLNKTADAKSSKTAAASSRVQEEQNHLLREGKGVTLNKYFRLFLVELLRLFDSDSILLERKGSLIVRHLCTYVDATAVYCTLAQILCSEEKYSFASLMVRELNTILFSAAELFEMRRQLENINGPLSWALFKTLYECWCHNPMATVALCLLSQNYQHAANIVSRFGEIEITAEVLQETDKLVQLIESPIFTGLRLQLLTPHQYPQLVQTLYGLLMLLPQTAAFSLLKHRLSCVPIINVLPHDNKKKSLKSIPKEIDFDSLLQHFVDVQRKHYTSRQKQIQQSLKRQVLEQNES